jgi:hypothetical protein
MIRSIRLFWRTARFEILAGIALSVALTIAMLVVALRLDDIRKTQCAGAGSCGVAAWTELANSFALPLMYAGLLVPLVVGLLYGPSLVGRELERRSAPLAWSLVASRVRWLVWRSWPALLLVVVLLVGPALAAQRLEAAAYPYLDPARSFNDFGVRGLLVVVRGLLAFSLGLAAGVVFGRTLPAVLVAGGLFLVAIMLAGVIRPSLLPREELPGFDANTSAEAPLYFGEGFRLPDGRLLTFAESTDLRPPEARELDSTGYRKWYRTSGWQRVDIGIPGTRLPDIKWREGLGMLLAAAAAFLLAAIAVRRRRPVPGLALEVDARRSVVPPATATPSIRPRWRRAGIWLSWLMTVRVGRPEVVGAVIASVAVTIATLLVIQLLQAARVAQGCVDSPCEGPGPFATIRNPIDDWLYPLLAALPFVVGGLLGVPVVAREVERGTARLSWSLTGSRIRWLLWRILPLLGLVIVLLVPAALAGNELLWVVWRIDPSYFFDHTQIRGAPLVARGLVMFAIALVAGALARRVLPALVIAAFAGLLVYNVLDGVQFDWMPLDVIGQPGEEFQPGSAAVTVMLQASDGTLHDVLEVAAAAGFERIGPDGSPVETNPDWIAWQVAHGYREVQVGWDASRYPEVVFRESAALVGGTLLMLAAGAVVIRSTRA